MKIGTREIGYDQPVFVVAEISCNHAGSEQLAHQLIRAADRAGADAVKFQCYTPDELAPQSDHPAYILPDGPWAGRNLHDLYVQARTPFAWFTGLIHEAEDHGMHWFASVFGRDSLAFMESLDCPAYKIASAEVTDLALVRAIAATGKPVILSDGMATDDQVEAAWDVIPADLVELRCVSDYPADPRSYSIDRDTEYLWGLSDHTTGNDVAIAAVALGACVVEKHLMLDPEGYGCDCKPELLEGRHDSMCPYIAPLDVDHSVTEAQFFRYVRAIRATEAMLSNPERKISGSAWRRRWVYARGLPAGHVLEASDVRTARCAEGREADTAIPVGWTLSADVRAGDPVLA